MPFFTALLLLFCSLNSARAGAITPAEAQDFYTAGLSSYSKVLVSLPRGGQACPESYAGLFSKDTLTISVFLGFIDSAIPGLVLDRPIKRALAAQLARSCTPGLLACGFVPSPGPEDGPAVLAKALPVTAGKMTVTVKLFDSSVSESGRECAGPLRARQQARSADTAAEYVKALGSDDIVLYMGHSRYGTGPGFFPVSFVSPAAVRAYIARPLLPLMRAALVGRSGPAPVLGFISCDSEKYYAHMAHAASPGSALLVSSGDSRHRNSAQALLGFLDSVLGKRCSGDLTRSLNGGGANRIFSFFGFFPEAPHPRYARHTPVMLILAALLFIPFLMILAPPRFAGCAPRQGIPGGPFRGVLFLAASFLPGLLMVRLFHIDRLLALPLVLAAGGYLALAFSLYRKRDTYGGPLPCAAGALPPLALAAAAYFCLTFLPEMTAWNAADSLLRALRLVLAFAALLPFCVLSGDILTRTDANSPVKGLARSAALNLALYLALALGLDLAGTGISVSLISVSVLALYLHGVSLLLRGRFGNIFGPAFFQALTLALIFAEGLQIFLYN